MTQQLLNMQQQCLKSGEGHTAEKNNKSSSIVKNCCRKITNTVSNTQKIHGKIIKK